MVRLQEGIAFCCFLSVPPSQTINVSSSYCPGVSSAKFANLGSGQTINVVFKDPTGRIIPLSPNEEVNLQIWALYTANNGSGDAQVGTLTRKTS
ncbi:MAG: hypothetical protein ACP5T4_02465 [Candidatus Micrarchaeia archaeon]